MGGPSIGTAYMDEDRVILEDVTFAIGAPGTGGATYTGDSEAADDGFAAEKYRFTPCARPAPSPSGAFATRQLTGGSGSRAYSGERMPTGLRRMTTGSTSDDDEPPVG
ncbi:hypothetical protein WME75_11610 [Sorangium sp. So ce1014]|uniref:hypothetical protein n=1 Tax=Sorangium sp. So ce1014 TaxID=3133326 RepID=UPI003F5E9B5F